MSDPNEVIAGVKDTSLRNFDEVGLGTLLRHLTELLDGDVEAVYRECGLDCRSRFTPVIRHLEKAGPSSLREISRGSGLTHSAISQTVAEMLKKGLVKSEPGKDARERVISFTPHGEAMLPRIHAVWSAIWTAAHGLSADIGVPLTGVLTSAIKAVDARSFRHRILAELPGSAETGRQMEGADML